MHVYITIDSGLNHPSTFVANLLQCKVDPGTPLHLRWSSLQQLRMAKHS